MSDTPAPTALELQLDAALAAENERAGKMREEADARRAQLAEAIKHYMPLNGYVLLKRAPAEERTAGGILLPSEAMKRPEEGIVCRIGTGRIAGDGSRIPMSVMEGDRVVFAPFTGNPVPRYGDDYMLIDESQILAVAERAARPSAEVEVEGD